MKKTRLILVLSLAMALILSLIPFTAHAAGEVNISVSANPATLSAAGSSTITVTVQNATDGEITDIALSYPGGGGNSVLSSIAAGSSKTDSAGCTISAADLGKDLPITITWNQGAEGSKSATKTVRIGAAAAPTVEFSRKPDKTVVELGSKVTLSYTIKNTSAVTLTNLTLSDSIVGTIASGITLAPGQSETKTTSVTINSEMTSSPKITYTAEGQSYNKTISSLKIGPAAKVSLTVAATANKTQLAATEKVTFSISIKNNSASDATGIKLVDELGTVISNNASVKANQSATLTCERDISQSTKVQFTATYPSGDSTSTAVSDPITITLAGQTPAPEPGTTPETPGTPQLSVIASVNPAQLPIPGMPTTVTFTIVIKNMGTAPVLGVAVTEPGLGQMGSIATLEAGAQQTITYEYSISQPSNYVFSASGADSDGNTVQGLSAAVPVSVSTGTAAPEGTMAPLVTQPPAGGGSLSTWFIVIIVIIVLIILAGIALVVLTIQERKSRNKNRNRPDPNGRGGRPSGGNRVRRPDGAPEPRSNARMVPPGGLVRERNDERYRDQGASERFVGDDTQRIPVQHGEEYARNPEDESLSWSPAQGINEAEAVEAAVLLTDEEMEPFLRPRASRLEEDRIPQRPRGIRRRPSEEEPARPRYRDEEEPARPRYRDEEEPARPRYRDEEEPARPRRPFDEDRPERLRPRADQDPERPRGRPVRDDEE